MSNTTKKPLVIALGAAFALTGAAAAQASVFQAADLESGYMLAKAGEGKCGEALTRAFQNLADPLALLLVGAEAEDGLHAQAGTEQGGGHVDIHCG